MTLPPRCERQVAIISRPPYRAVICPRSAVPGTKWCDEHQHPVTIALIARPWNRAGGG